MTLSPPPTAGAGGPSPPRNIYMNVYQDTSMRMNNLWRIVALWKGSVFKLIWHDLLIFLVCYCLLSVVSLELFHDKN